MKSKFLSINWKDAAKGFIVAFLTVLLSFITVAIEDIDALTWSNLWITTKVGILSGASYVIKNFFTNSEEQFLKQEPAK
jgi:hypothetical protein